MRAAVLPVLIGCLAQPGYAQAEAGIDTMMSLCIPISATGTSIRAGLTESGWTAQTPQSGLQARRDLIGSQMWSFFSDATPSQRLELVDDVVIAVGASMVDPNFAEIYTHEGEVVLILSQGPNISCLWVGPEDEAFDARVAAIGGFPMGVPESTTTTAALTQTVEAGGSDWTRIENYARIDASDRTGPYPAAARLDRSPAQ
ncbi:hypothetical protein SAMN04488005_2316 [Yoonia tamlensis]|uniref:Uncharacterized protein n=1 Tax=Yoonia tamlensis TaxID=390270 RepID=A0A1I6GXT8_9RHOB|nr:hypothetical protein [Yoonia tamlensis]SFR47012.1 hypothetical protein SAMN04488005_2316 [Yoonia tamlensis]